MKICPIFSLNILRFEFPNVLLLFYVANVTKVSVFSLLNYICQIANLFSFHEMYTFLLGSNVVTSGQSLTDYVGILIPEKD